MHVSYDGEGYPFWPSGRHGSARFGFDVGQELASSASTDSEREVQQAWFDLVMDVYW